MKARLANVSTLIPTGSKILVTGVNGFIASHVADQLLEDGYNVRGTVRSDAKGTDLLKHFESTYGKKRFELIVVPDIGQDGVFDKALKDISGIVHLATAATFTTDPKESIPGAVAGALNVFKAAAKESGIRSIVYTSDSFAALLPQSNKTIHILQTTYNEDSVTAAFDASSAEQIRKSAWDPATAFELNVYAAAKVAAEKSIWQFVEEQKPTFQVSTVLPNVNIGASVGGMPLSSTGAFVPKLLAGETSGMFFPAQHYVNVRDCAQLHVVGLLDPDQRNKRIFAMASPFNWNDVLAILRRLMPHMDIMNDMPDLGRDLSVLPNEPADQLLRKHYRHGWTGLEESVRQNIEST